jgi:hypothetical protein
MLGFALVVRLILDRLYHLFHKAPIFQHQFADRWMPVGDEIDERLILGRATGLSGGANHDVQATDAVEQAGQERLIPRDFGSSRQDLAKRSYGDTFFP